MGALRYLLTDVAIAEQAQRPAEQPARFRVLLFVPRTRAQLRNVVRDAAIEREQQRERELGDGNRVLARTVRDVDAALRRRRDVDRVVAGAGANDERERARLEHRRGHGRAADDEDVGRAVANRRRQPIVFQIGLVDDVAAGNLQSVEA